MYVMLNFLTLDESKFSVFAKLLFTFLIVLMLASCDGDSEASSVDPSSIDPSVAGPEPSLNYGFVYWENGLPTRTPARRPSSWVTDKMITNPDIIIQTGFYSVRFGTDDLSISGYDTFDGDGYLSDLIKDVTTLTPAELNIEVKKNGVIYTATEAKADEKQVSGVSNRHLYVRLIKSGQYVQRFDHTGFIFKDKDGNTLYDVEPSISGGGVESFKPVSYLEFTAWPDRLAITLEFPAGMVERSKLSLTYKGKVIEATGDHRVNLALHPQSHSKVSELSSDLIVLNAHNTLDDASLSVAFDADSQAIGISYKPQLPKYNKGPGGDLTQDMDMLDELSVTLFNPYDEPISIPVVFTPQSRVSTITGMTMLLNYEEGSPSGIPVQISKNWHSSERYAKYNGQWLRGYTMLQLEPGEKKTYKLRAANGYWDRVGAASHAQLSLVGWNAKSSVNWKWEESAIGAWGETMTFDPVKCIADVRPSWTRSKSGTSDVHDWTSNYGGGNFLVYYDSDNKLHWNKGVKTAFVWSGPNITNTYYSGKTDDDKIRFIYQTQLFRSNDYHRRSLSFEYQFLQDVVKPAQLAFFQTSADLYITTGFDSFYLGHNSGKPSLYKSQPGGEGYKDKYPFTNSWIAYIDHCFTSEGPSDEKCSSGNVNTLIENQSYRSLLYRDLKYNESTIPAYIHAYGYRRGRDHMLFDLAGEATDQTYYRGDNVKGEVLFMMPVRNDFAYWGNDEEFRQRLTAYSAEEVVWKPTQDEFDKNALTPTVMKGKLLSSYPLEIENLDSEKVSIEFSIPSGQGIGHIPVVIHKAPKAQNIRIELWDGASWTSIANNSGNVDTHLYYQGYLNSDGVSMDYAFNVARVDNNLDSELKVRVYSEFVAK